MMQHLGTMHYDQLELVNQLRSYIKKELDIDVAESAISVRTMLSQNMPLDYNGETDVTMCRCKIRVLYSYV